MDRGLRLRTPHRSTVGPANSSCPHPGDERRQLPTQAKPPQKKPILRPLRPLPANAASGEKGLFRYAPEPLLPRKTPPYRPHYWSPFTPPQWFPFTPALTDGFAFAKFL